MEFHEYRDTLVGTGYATRELLDYWNATIKFDFRLPIEPMQIDASKISLPFDVILVRLREEDCDLFLYCNRTSSGFIGVTGSAFFSDGHCNMCVFRIWPDLRIENAGPSVAERSPEAAKLLRLEEDQSVIENRAKALGAFLTVLNQPNQRLEDYTPSAKLNKKRLERGRTPLVAYKTLTLTKPAVIVETTPRGGTHASPRLHVRRGHFRNARGRQTWVKPTVVGDKARGMVMKSYRVQQTSAPN